MLREESPATDHSDEVDEATSVHTPLAQGRPRIDLLDSLTVELTSVPGQNRRYRCAGKGCNKIWSPRSLIRVLSHSKQCLRLTVTQRQLASKSSASSAPGALVEADQKGLRTDTSTESLASSTAAPRSDVFFGAGGRRQLHHSLDLAIVKLFCIARIPPAVVDSFEWKELFRALVPSYAPASSTRLMEGQIMSEQERVRALNIAHLSTQTHVTISFDGGNTRSGDSFYTVSATTADRTVILLEGKECSLESHTGEWIARLVLRVSLFIPSYCLLTNVFVWPDYRCQPSQPCGSNCCGCRWGRQYKSGS